MKKITLIVSIVFALTLLGCSKDDDSSSKVTGNTITLTMNGENITATLVEARLIKSSGTNEKLLEIIAENNEYKFELNYFSTYSDNDAIPTGNYVYDDDNSIVDGYAYVSYKLNSSTYGLHFPHLGNLNISSIDGGAKKVSGSFNQVLDGGGSEFNGQTLPVELVITNGQFANLPYTVVNL